LNEKTSGKRGIQATQVFARFPASKRRHRGRGNACNEKKAQIQKPEKK